MRMLIGSLADAASVNVQTVRYYERRGLLATPDRTPAGYRQYSPDAISRIRFIKRAQYLGFSLKEVDELLSLRVRRDTVCSEVEEKTTIKLSLVDQKIRELEAIKAALENLVEACHANTVTGDCPIIDTLEGRRTA